MEFQCKSCNRIFRVPDNRVTASGIKFKCTKCGASVNITPEDIRAQKLLSENAPVSGAEPQVAANTAVADTPSATSSFSPAVDAASADTIHPLVSGSLAGAFGGIGCAIPVLAITLLGIGSLSVLSGGRVGLPLGQTMLITGASVIGFGVLIGIVLASFQARSENKIFGFPGVLIGTLLGAAFGAIEGLIAAAGSGAVFSIAVIIGSAIGWGFKALLLSIVVVLARRSVATSSTESTSATISGGQLLGIGLACLVAFLGIFGDVRTALNAKTVREEASQAYQNMASADGLEVASSSTSWDSGTGDLVLSVAIENKGETEKKVWYLLAKISDGSGNVLTTVKMLTGKQLYTHRDYEVMRRRGADIQNLVIEHMKQPETPLAAHSTLNVEMRVLEPPSGIASFDVTFQPIDPVKMFQEAMEEAKKEKAEEASSRGH